MAFEYASVVLLVLASMFSGSHGGRSIVSCPNSRQCEGKLIVGTMIDCNSYGACDMASITQKGTLGYVACTGNHACGEATYIKAGSQVYCQGYYSCVLTTKIEGSMIQCSGSYACMTAHSLTADNTIYCGGYKACPDTNLEAGRTIYCDGLNSCTGSTATSGGDIICQGTKSCLKGKLTTTGTLECSGNMACKSSRITASKVKLTGARSGEKTRIEADETIATGYMALSSTEVSSGNRTRIKVKTSAEAAGTDATVICETGSECVVDCTDGCDTLEVVSYSGSSTSVTSGSTTCDASMAGTDGCPTIKESTGGCMDRELDLYMQNKRELIERRLALQDEQEMQELLQEENMALDDHAAAVAAAEDAIWPEITSCNKWQQCQDQMIMDEDAQCYGFESCLGASVNQQSFTTASVGAYGEKSLMSGFIHTAGAVGCNGKDACSYSNYFSAGSALCGGYEACAYSTQSLLVSTLDCEATGSCRDNVMNVKKTAKCVANRACYNSEIVAGNNVLCEGSYSCSLGDVDSAAIVKCTGFGACHKAVIKAGKYVYIDGDNGASEATIYAPAVRVFAAYGISGSLIDSNHTDLAVKLFSDFAGNGGTILCRAGSNCKVSCEASGCRNLDLLCLANSTCSVTPRECLRPKTPIKIGEVFCPNINQSASLQQDAKLMTYIEQQRERRARDPEYVENVITAMKSVAIDELELYGDNAIVKQIEMQNEVNNDQHWLWRARLLSWRVVVVAAAAMIVFVVYYIGRECLQVHKQNTVMYQQLK